MKAIGIVTINDYYNFGNRLQNYALQHFLEANFDCSVITLEGYEDPHPRKGRFISWIKEEMAGRLSEFSGVSSKLIPPYTMRWGRFQSWSKRYISRERYYDCEMLPEELNESFDLFLAGSDQIWNCTFSHFREGDFFLRFADPSKRVSVAASFGLDEIPEERKKAYKEGLSGFAGISVREESGKRIVKDLTGRDVQVIPDPALMLTDKEWLEVSQKAAIDPAKPYVMKFYLGEPKDRDIDDWAMSQGFALYDLMNHKDPAVSGTGPGEFISLINGASMIATDSFHCVVFAILFSKPFIVYDRDGSGDMSSRLVSLLERFGMSERWEHRLDRSDLLKCDFTCRDKILGDERKKFIEYIEASTGMKPVSNGS